MRAGDHDMRFRRHLVARVCWNYLHVGLCLHSGLCPVCRLRSLSSTVGSAVELVVRPFPLPAV